MQAGITVPRCEGLIGFYASPRRITNNLSDDRNPAGGSPRPYRKEVSMLQRSLLFLAIGVSLLLCSGCVAKSDYLQKQAEADALTRNLAAISAENAGLRDRIERLNAEREKLTVERDDLNTRLGALAEELARTTTETQRTIFDLKRRNVELEGDKQMLEESIALVKKNKEEAVQNVSKTYEGLLEAVKQEKFLVSKTYEGLLKEMKEEIEHGQIAITELKGKLTVDVVDKILFDSGQAEIKPEGLAVLKRVVDILITVMDKTIRVEGHTDNVPIAGALAKRYPTNWELSAARALTVTRYLEKEGLDPTLLSAAAFGEYQPVADNETAEGRAKNRRIAIILLPKEER
jgi:chemotaxis protein MotB